MTSEFKMFKKTPKCFSLTPKTSNIKMRLMNSGGDGREAEREKDIPGSKNVGSVIVW